MRLYVAVRFSVIKLMGEESLNLARPYHASLFLSKTSEPSFDWSPRAQFSLDFL